MAKGHPTTESGLIRTAKDFYEYLHEVYQEHGYNYMLTIMKNYYSKLSINEALSFTTPLIQELEHDLYVSWAIGNGLLEYLQKDFLGEMTSESAIVISP